MKNYLISIVLANYNAISLIKESIESLKKQTYKNFELIVIDNLSNDGSIEYLKKQKKSINIKIISEKDDGISDAYAKGLRNVNGDIVGIFSVDERYYPTTFEKVIRWFNEYPNNIVCGGTCKFIDDRENIVSTYKNENLNLKNHLKCSHIIAINTCFFNKRILKNELYYDASNKSCMDFEFWARLSLKYDKKYFRWFDVPIVKSKLTQDSMSFRSESFDLMIRDKIKYLKSFLKKNKNNNYIKTNINLNECIAGIYLWAAKQTKYISGNIHVPLKYINKSYKFKKNSADLKLFIKDNALKISKDKNKILLDYPKNKNKSIKITDYEDKLYNGAKKDVNSIIHTSSGSWEYSYELDFKKIYKNIAQVKAYKWIELDVTLLDGKISVGTYKKNKLYQEIIIKNKNVKTNLMLKINNQSSSVMFRNADHYQYSSFKINKTFLLG